MDSGLAAAAAPRNATWVEGVQPVPTNPTVPRWSSNRMLHE
jgi:hypothetical protein